MGHPVFTDSVARARLLVRRRGYLEERVGSPPEPFGGGLVSDTELRSEFLQLYLPGDLEVARSAPSVSTSYWAAVRP